MAKTTKKAATAAPEKEVKAAESKAVATKTAEAKTAAKATEKKTAEKKTTAKKPACKTSVCVEMSGLSVSVADIQTAVKKAVKEKGLEATDLKIYINAAEHAAYYTVDGEGGEESKIDLNTL